MEFLGSDREMTKPGGVERQRQSLCQMGAFIQRSVNFKVAAIKQKAVGPCLHIDFFTKDCSMRLNSLFISSVMRATLAGNDYPSINVVFSAIMAYIDLEVEF